jgi:hypothetical protein
MRDAVEALVAFVARSRDSEPLRVFFENALRDGSHQALSIALHRWRTLPTELRERVVGDRRRHKRFRASASVQINGAEEIPLLTVLDLSLTGAFLISGGTDLTIFADHSRHSVVVFEMSDPDLRIAVTARVVRHDDQGMAIDWSCDVGATDRVRQFLLRTGSWFQFDDQWL